MNHREHLLNLNCDEYLTEEEIADMESLSYDDVHEEIHRTYSIEGD